MRHRRLILGFAVGFLAGLAALPASAQFRGSPQIRLAAQKKPNTPAIPRNNLNPNNSPAVKGQPNVRAMEGLPPVWVERLRDMPPEDQQHFLQNNQQFRNLPPQRQEQIRKNLENWNRLSTEQKNALRNEAAFLESMSPQQRQYVKNVLLPQWQALPQARRQAINNHLRMLRSMGPATQQAVLNDPKFVEGLSSDEQLMLRDLNSLRNPSLE